MKTIILVLVVLLTSRTTRTQYKPDAKGSSVTFTIKNFGISTGGSFSGLNGDIQFDIKDLSRAVFNVSIDANTINTDNDTRDNHLRQQDYFDVKKYPHISFVSTRVVQSDKAGVLLLYGKLTIKSQVKDISFPFTVIPSGNGYLFKGSFSINRKEFGVGGTSVISNNLEVQLNVLATQ